MRRIRLVRPPFTNARAPARADARAGELDRGGGYSPAGAVAAAMSMPRFVITASVMFTSRSLT